MILPASPSSSPARCLRGLQRVKRCLTRRVKGGLFWLLAFSVALPALRADSVSEAFAREADRAARRAINEVLLAEPDLPQIDIIPVAVPNGPITLQQALRIAVANNLVMRNRRDQVRLAAMELVAVQRGYGPQWVAVISAMRKEIGTVIEDLRSTTQQTTSAQTIGVSQVLPFGGSLSLDVGGGYSRVEVGQPTYSPRAGVSLSQPLLRGAGRDLQQEPLVAARRNLLYAMRNYKLTLEDFCIGVINDYLTIQNQRKKIDAAEEKRLAFERLTRRSQTFFDLGRESEIEVLRAQQEEQLATQTVLSLEVELKRKLDQFAILLNTSGESGAHDLALEEFPIPYIRQDLDADRIVSLALSARPDLRTAASAIEDRERQLRFARRDMLPDLAVNLRAGTASADSLGGSGVIREEYSAGVTLSLPLERRKEKLAVFSASQNLAQSQRSFDLSRAIIAAGVRYSVNRVEGIEKAVAIQEDIVKSSEKRAKIAEFRFERGEASNRNLIEAQTLHHAALNSRLDLYLSHYIATLQLRRDMGRLESTTVMASLP